jgi:hypothetical protein
MPFEMIENLAPPKVNAVVPPDGLAVKACTMSRKGGGSTSYIRLALGARLSKRLGFHQPTHGVQLLFGTGKDAGKVCVSVNNAGAQFTVTRNKRNGYYVLTINRRTADGLFAENFPPFSITHLEVIGPDNGQPKHTVFPASPEMLKVEDE